MPKTIKIISNESIPNRKKRIAKIESIILIDLCKRIANSNNFEEEDIFPNKDQIAMIKLIKEQMEWKEERYEEVPIEVLTKGS